MRYRLLSFALIASAALAAVAIYLWPAIALAGRAILEWQAPELDPQSLPDLRWNLLSRTTFLSALAAALTLLVSLPPAFALARLGPLRRRPILAGLLLANLLIPPMTLAFGWDRLLPAWISPPARTILVWIAWAWPIPAAILALAWRTQGRPGYEAALLDASPWRAFAATAPPVLLRPAAVSLLITFTLFFADYGVPHAFATQVYATELLLWTSSSTRILDGLWPALPAVAVTVAALAAVLAFTRTSAASITSPPPDQPSSRSNIAAALIPLWTAIAVGLPLAWLLARHLSITALAETWRVHGTDLAWSLWIAAVGAALATILAAGALLGRTWRFALTLGTILAGALPGALTGAALIAAYNFPAEPWDWLYDRWPILSLGYAARFGWVACLAVYALACSDSWRELADQAAVDGASSSSIICHIRLPLALPALAAGFAMVLALALAEVPAASLLRVPGFAPISQVAIEKFHRFEDAMLATISLWLAFAAILAATSAGTLVRRVLR